MVHVLLAIRHYPLRAALQEYLSLPGEVRCGHAANPEELWSQLLSGEWNVLILDMCLPDHTKLRTVRTLHDTFPGLPIVAISFSVRIGPRYWEASGASGFVSKAALSAQLREAVHTVNQGGKYFSMEGGAETLS
jgi:DNA-binding NarL/FixJ family response regulator